MVEMVDSQQEELSVEDIVAIAGMNTDSEYDTRTATAALTAELNMPNTLFLRQGNTLFVIHKAAPRVGYFRALNADTARNFLENGREFIAACYKMGFDTMASEFTDPTVLGVFRYISQNPPNPEMGYEVRREEDGGFYVTVKCGPKRGA
jgi:hypothetical protein